MHVLHNVSKIECSPHTRIQEQRKNTSKLQQSGTRVWTH